MSKISVFLLVLVILLLGHGVAAHIDLIRDEKQIAAKNTETAALRVMNAELTGQLKKAQAQVAELVSGRTFALESGVRMLGSFRVTHYCICAKCCGSETGITASGRSAIPEYSIAVDPSVIPLGSLVLVDYGDGVLHEYRADDTGNAVTGFTLDLCVDSHETALSRGVRQATVYIERSNGE